VEVAHLDCKKKRPREPSACCGALSALRKLAMQSLDHKLEGLPANGLARHKVPAEARLTGSFGPSAAYPEPADSSLDSRQMLAMGNIKLTRSIWESPRVHLGSLTDQRGQTWRRFSDPGSWGRWPKRWPYAARHR
jgi:hypothetical protein